MEGTQELREMLQAGAFNMRQELTSPWLAVQLVAILIAAGLALLLARAVQRRIDTVSAGMGWPGYLRLLLRLLIAHLGTIVFIIIVAAARAAMLTVTWPSHSYVLHVVASLASAWVAIAILTALIRTPLLQRVVAIFAWTIAALSIVDLLHPTMAALDAIGISVGGVHVTPLLIIKASVLLAFTLWIANTAGDFLERGLQRQGDLTPSLQVLISKIMRLLLLTFAVLIVLSSLGIDFSALAFFSGAVGVGIGFGLQKIVSNLFSGIILLTDKSIKPGDIISVGEHFGRVGNMGARYTSVDTRDGREYLIPNEDFITQRVANWTYSSDFVRLDVKFNATYDSDPHTVQDAAIKAALEVERVLHKPAPACMLSAFGTTSVEFQMWFWINNPSAGIDNVKSDVLLALWNALAVDGARLAKPGPARVIYEMADGGPLPGTSGASAPRNRDASR
jgi:small-conductance mechanosensitive channel